MTVERDSGDAEGCRQSHTQPDHTQSLCKVESGNSSVPDPTIHLMKMTIENNKKT
jgi:hypothetical protein